MVGEVNLLTEGTAPAVGKSWTLMATHGMVLFYIAANSDSTMRAMSEALGITERRVAQVVKDLAEGGLIVVKRDGRRNVYSVNIDATFRHPTLSHVKLSRFVDALNDRGPSLS